MQKIFTQVVKEKRRCKMTTMSNITAEAMNQTIYQRREDNTRLRTQLADLIRELRSMIAVKTTPT